MTYGVILILILVAISGLIAYLGDYLGRYCGKKRISLFGLRPKYTSILIAVVTGVFITSLTFAFLLTVSKGYRRTLFGLQQMTSDLQKAGSDLRTTRGELKRITGKYDRNEIQLRRITGEIERKSTELDELKKSSKVLKDDVDRLTRERILLDADRRRLVKDVRSKAIQIGDTNKTILYGEILYTKDQPLARIVVARDVDESALKNRFEEVIENIRKAATGAGAKVDRESALYESQYQGLMNDMNDAHGDMVIEIRSATNVLRNEPLILKFHIVENRIVYRRGSAIASERISEGMSENQATQFLQNLMLRASQAARRSGVIPNVDTGKVASVPAQRFLDTVSRITNLSTSKSVVIFAVDDTRIADKLQVDFAVKD